jgi:hypothetical protein
MQGVWVFADAAARTAAVTSPEEGNMSFLKDTNSTEYYSGSAWVAVASNPAFVGCILNRSTNAAGVVNNTWTAVALNNEIVDTNGFHDNSSNPSRITIPTGYGGKYDISANAYWGTTAGGGNRGSRVYKNGAILLDFGQKFVSSSTEFSEIAWNGIVSLTAGDYIEFYVYQNSGGDLGYYTLGTEGANWSVQYLGA